MNRFAELLDRLAYEPGRNNKLRLMTDYFRTTPDPERGWALAALTGSLSFPHAKAGLIRSLIAERTDPVLFELSYDYVGDLSETVALMWPSSSSPACGGGGERSDARGGKCLTLAQASPPQAPSLPSPASGGAIAHPHCHGRTCSGHPRLRFDARLKDVDARNERGHDETRSLAKRSEARGCTQNGTTR